MIKALSPKGRTDEDLREHAERLVSEMGLSLTADQKGYLASEIRNTLAPVVMMAQGEPQKISQEELDDAAIAARRLLALVNALLK